MTSNLVPLIKKAAIDAVAASKPMCVLSGEVVSVEPLCIAIEQRFMLTEEFIIVPSRFSNQTIDGTIVNESGQTQNIKINIDNALKVGDPVLLLVTQGGQKYIVLERGSTL